VGQLKLLSYSLALDFSVTVVALRWLELDADYPRAPQAATQRSWKLLQRSKRMEGT
jgi:hypothetical protein